jgi:hypothetical protein
MTDYEKLVSALKSTRLPVTVKVDSDGGINVECGMDYPDRFFHDVMQVVEPLKLKCEVSICASMSSSKTVERIHVNGGYGEWEREYDEEDEY